MRKFILDLCMTGGDLKPQTGYLDGLIENQISIIAVACANQGIEGYDKAPDDLDNFEFLKRPSCEIKKELAQLHEKQRAPLSADHQNCDEEFVPLVTLDRAVVLDDFEKILVPTDPGVSLFLSCLRFELDDAKAELLQMTAGERKRYLTASLEAAAMAPGFVMAEFEQFFDLVFDDLDIEITKQHIPFLKAEIEARTSAILMRRRIADEDDAPVAPRRRSVERA